MAFSLLPSQSANFQSPFSIEETKERLNAAFFVDKIGERVDNWHDDILFIKINEDDCRITRHTIWRGWWNATCPMFYGKFYATGDSCVIKGIFRLNKLLIWRPAFFAIFATILAITSLYKNSHTIVVCIILALYCLFSLYAAWLFRKGDINIISNAIESALK